jgi:sulfatase modifying factor 1
MKKLIPIAIAALAVACSKSGTTVMVSVTAAGPLSAASLQATASAAGQTKQFSIPLAHALPPAISFVVDVPPSITGTLSVRIDAYDTQQNLLASAAGSTPLAAGQRENISITLSGSVTTDMAGSDMAGAGSGDMANASADLMMGPSPDMTFVPSALPSCTNLVTNCGPTINDSCCESPLVPGGMFYRGSDVGTGTPDTNNPATVSDFRLDKYEVTVGRFRRFVDAGMGTQANPPASGAGANPYTASSGWDPTWNTSLVADTTTLKSALQCDSTSQTWTTSPGTDNQPINCVTWYEAFAFCAWDGGFLPTEAEWTYAAYGGSEERPYPWTGTTIDCTYANYNIGGGALSGSCKGGATAVGIYSPKGDGKWLQSDLQGNVEEWILDWFNSSFINPCTNCADFDSASSYKVVCGGSFALGAFAQVNSWRDDRTGPATRGSAIGFRCARPK